MAIGMSFVGVGLTLVGAAGLAFGMVVQRYALSTCNRTVPVCGFEVHRLLAWALGLVLYALANGFYAVAQIFAPLSLLSGVFATLILFNLVFARLLLGEELTPPKVTGSFIIFVGVIMCIVSMATDAETEFTPSDIEDLLGRPAGLCWLLFLCGAVLSTMVAIGVHEWRYPVRFQSARLCRENKCVGDNAGPDPVRRRACRDAFKQTQVVSWLWNFPRSSMNHIGWLQIGLKESWVSCTLPRWAWTKPLPTCA